MKEQLIIKRSEWYRGHGGADSCLYIDGREVFCCLGLYGRDVCKIPKYNMAGIADSIEYNKSYTAYDDYKGIPNFPDWMKTGNNPNDYDILCKIIRVNDNPEISNADREAELTRLFALKDIEVTFVD